MIVPLNDSLTLILSYILVPWLYGQKIGIVDLYSAMMMIAGAAMTTAAANHKDRDPTLEDLKRLSVHAEYVGAAAGLGKMVGPTQKCSCTVSLPSFDLSPTTWRRVHITCSCFDGMCLAWAHLPPDCAMFCFVSLRFASIRMLPVRNTCVEDTSVCATQSTYHDRVLGWRGRLAHLYHHQDRS